MDNIAVTQETYDKLVKDLDNYKRVERPKVIEALQEARAQGDLSENAEYDAAKDRQGEVEARINWLEDRVARATVIKYNPSKSETIKFGATVKAKNMKTGREVNYQLVSPDGVDPINGKISFKSPIGKAFMGKKRGDITEVETPRGINKFEIIDYK